MDGGRWGLGGGGGGGGKGGGGFVGFLGRGGGEVYDKVGCWRSVLVVLRLEAEEKLL